MACQTNSAVEVLDPIKENYDNYLLIDVGSNMVNKKFSRDLELVLQRAKDSGEFDTRRILYVDIPCLLSFFFFFIFWASDFLITLDFIMKLV